MIGGILQSHPAIEKVRHKMALADFKVWISHAAPGEPWVYYRGFLMADREYKHLHPDLHPAPLAADALARMVYKLQTEGAVLLTQRRIGFCDYEYIATKPKR